MTGKPLQHFLNVLNSERPCKYFVWNVLCAVSVGLIGLGFHSLFMPKDIVNEVRLYQVRILSLMFYNC